MSKFSDAPNCFNCQQPITKEETFCSNCGQKHHDGKYSVLEVISEFISTNFNLDAKIFQTLWGLMKPGYLTEQYFKGVHKTYYKPIRLFLVIGVIVLAFISPKMDNDSKLINSLREAKVEKQMEANWDSLRTIIKTRSDNEALNIGLDTMSLFAGVQKLAIMEGIDSILEAEDKSVEDMEFDIGGFNVGMNNEQDSFKLSEKMISNMELLNYAPHEIVERNFPDKPWYHKKFLTQILKLSIDGQGLIAFIFSRLPIFLLFLSPLYALVFQLLYIRKKRYFVEHFVFLLHLYSATMLLLLLNTIFYWITHKWIAKEVFTFSPLIIMLLYFVYFFVAMKRYYKQSFGKTFMKFLIANFLSMFVATFAFIFILVVGILIF